jgi:hypothetical protein
MKCLTIADVLASLERYRLEASHADIRDNSECPAPVATAPPAVRGWGERSVAQTNRNRERNRAYQRAKRAREAAADAPVSREVVASRPAPSSPPCAPWLRLERIAAASSRDVIERLERGMDDRSYAQKSALGTRLLAEGKTKRPPTFRARRKAEVADAQ